MISLEDLRNATGGQLFGEVRADQFHSFCLHSDEVQPGSLFVLGRDVPRVTTKALEQALQRGAAGLLCEQPPTLPDVGITVILVGDVAAAMQQWAAYVLRQRNISTIGIGGGIGARIAQQAVAAVLGRAYAVLAVPDRPHGLLSLPLTLQHLTDQHQIAFVSLDADSETELKSVLSASGPVVAALMPDYLRRVHGEAERAALHEQLARFMPEQGLMLMHEAGALSQQVRAQVRCPFVTYGQAKGDIATPAELLAYDQAVGLNEVRFSLRYQTEKFRGLQLAGCGPDVLNAALIAVGVGLSYSIPIDEIKEALATFEGPDGCMRYRETSQGWRVIDLWGAEEPEDALKALDWLKNIPQGESEKRWFVLGSVPTPADHRGAYAAQLGRQAGDSVNQVLVFDALKPEIAAQSALQRDQVERVHLCFRPADAQQVLEAGVQPGDVVLVAGAVRSLGSLLGTAQASAARPAAAPERGSPYIELDLNALAANVGEVKRRLRQQKSAIIARVGSNAFGHGLLPIAATLLHNGAEALAVNNPQEGIDLRQAGITAPILVLGPVKNSEIEDALQHDLSLSIFNQEQGRAFSNAAGQLRQPCKVHLCVDTGYGYLGEPVDKVPTLVRDLMRSEFIHLEGIYTHLATADDLIEVATTREHLRQFQVLLKGLSAIGLQIKYIHAANSSALLTLSESYLSTVRLGTALYGLSPSPMISRPPSISPVLAWKTEVAQVKRLPAGSRIGTQHALRLDRETHVAVINVGYAHGFRARPRHSGEVLLRGRRAPILGEVGETETVVSVKDIPDAAVGDEVVLIGSQLDDRISVEDVAQRMETTVQEVIMSISPHLPRLLK